jgi:hypothetical protein
LRDQGSYELASARITVEMVDDDISVKEIARDAVSLDIVTAMLRPLCADVCQ